MKSSVVRKFKARKPIYLPKQNTENKPLNKEQLNDKSPLLVVTGIPKSDNKQKEKVHTCIPDDISVHVEIEEELKGTTKEVVNLPVLHQSKSLEVHEGARDSRTIKRTYERSDTLSDKFLNIFALTGVMDDKDSDIIDAVVDTNKVAVDPLENFHSAISPYPPVEDDEIEKHKNLNAEAEKNNSSRPPTIDRQHYLERLKLKRQAIADQKARELKLQKRKFAKRAALQRQAAVQKDANELFMEQRPPSPPKPKIVEAKPIKLILGFKYSYAIEQHYRNQMKHFGSGLTFLNDTDNNREDVLNGWIVKTLGPAVLNMRARTLPSCNPIELRMRTRMRGNRKSRNSHLTWSRESSKTGSMLKSQDSFSKINAIKEERIRGHSNLPSKGHKVLISEKVNVIANGDENSEETDKLPELPIIKSCEKMFITAPKLKKEISLKLPTISVDD